MSTALAHSPTDVLRWLLVAQGQAASPLVVNADGDPTGDWPAYIDNEPDSPDNVLTLYDTAPKDNGRSMINGETFRHRGIQVRIRAATFTEGFAKAEAIRVYLDEQVYDAQVDIGANDYLVRAVYRTSLVRLGKESPKSKRNLFTINCLTIVHALPLT